MYNASDFADFELGMTAEFEDSLTRPGLDMRIIDESFNRNNMSTDCTRFLLNIHCERQDGLICIDRLFGSNVPINLSGTPMFRGQNDTYFIPDLNDPILHPPSPLICFVNDALIGWNKQNGRKYRGEAADIEQIIYQAR
jgi:hypothetical protein